MPLTTAPVVSVIIATYNRAWSLGRAVDSVLAQDYANFELIVVDDGSTDQTPALLDGYGPKLTVIRQDHQGVSAARNAGIGASRGDLVAFLDSDDQWLPPKLSVQTAFLTQNPEALICQTQEIWVRKGVRVNPGRRHAKIGGDIFIPSLELCLISPSAVMMRRRLLDAVGLFDGNLPVCEDYDLWLRVSRRYPVHLLDQPLVIRHAGHVDQLSAQPRQDKCRIESLKKILAMDDLTETQRTAAIAILQKKCRIYAAGCLKRGRRLEAMYYTSLANLWR
jgi:glycosyltransferase involved in cell wall biosynthesis